MNDPTPTIPALLETRSAQEPLAVVITGTMPRDEETFRLVQVLNELSRSGKIKVYYCPPKDTEPLLTKIDQNHIRTVNPLRADDLIVATDIPRDDSLTEHERIGKKLTASGEPCFVLAYPSLTSPVTTTQVSQVRTLYDSYVSDKGERTLTVDVHYPSVNILSPAQSLDAIGLGNIAFAHLVTGPDVVASFDKDKTRDSIARKVQRHSMTATSAALDKALNEIASQGPQSLGGASSLEILDTNGIEHAQHSHCESMTDAVVQQLRVVLDAEQEIADAFQTADTIIADAHEKAEVITGDAHHQADEIIDQAHATAEEVMDAATETALLIPELPEMMEGALGTLLSTSRKEEQRISDEKSRALREKRLAVKEYITATVTAYRKIDEVYINSLGLLFDTQTSRDRTHDVMIDLINPVTKSGPDSPDAAGMSERIDRSNIGYEPLSLEDALRATALHWFFTHASQLETVSKIRTYSQELYSRSSISQWGQSDEDLGQALLKAFTAHAAQQGFTHEDREFIAACDEDLGGVVTATLAGALERERSEHVDDELSAISGIPDQENPSLNAVLNQIEVHAGASHAQPAFDELSATLEEIDRLARESSDPDITHNGVHTRGPVRQVTVEAIRQVELQTPVQAQPQVARQAGAVVSQGGVQMESR